MKLQFKPVSAAMKFFAAIAAIVVCIMAPLTSIGQPPPPGGGGGSPDPAVPFDDNMNLVFLVIGLVFVAFVYYRYYAKKSVKTA